MVAKHDTVRLMNRFWFAKVIINFPKLCFLIQVNYICTEYEKISLLKSLR